MKESGEARWFRSEESHPFDSGQGRLFATCAKDGALSGVTVSAELGHPSDFFSEFGLSRLPL